MNNQKPFTYCILDIEADGLLDTITKIHCLSYNIYTNKELIESGSLLNYKDITDFILKQEVIVGHNIIRYDIIALEKILNINIKAKLIDSLSVSFYLYPISKFKHGLEAWGERLGFKKPIIKENEWLGPLVGETQEEFNTKMIHRCESDVTINSKLFHSQMKYLNQIYSNKFDIIIKLFDYLAFKFDCLKDQEEQGIDLDVRLAEKSKFDLEFIIQEKLNSLSSNMATDIGKILWSKPKICYKKDKTLSHYGAIWFQRLEDNNLPKDTLEIREKPNPASPIQLKEWLHTLGWKPSTFKISKSTGKKVPQVSLPFGGGLCPSITKMFQTYNYLKDLDGLMIARHRYGKFKSFLNNKDKKNKVYSTAHGFTNTLRLQHSKPCENLVKVSLYYGKELRGCLKVPNDEYIMCGSDITALEDSTKQHYIYPYDPDYVNDMRTPGFDPHLDIGILANILTLEDSNFYKWYENLTDIQRKSKSNKIKDRYNNIKNKRFTSKSANFSATYGAGGPKIAEIAKISVSKGIKLHSIFWERNHAIKKVANSVPVKRISTNTYIKGIKADKIKQKWIYNSLSGFWLFLKADKDKFSTLNQSSGVFIFDYWLREVRIQLKKYNIKIIYQYHDEIIFILKKEHKEKVEEILQSAIEKINKEIKLNVPIGISTQFGKNYSEIH